MPTLTIWADLRTCGSVAMYETSEQLDPARFTEADCDSGLVDLFTCQCLDAPTYIAAGVTYRAGHHAWPSAINREWMCRA